MAQTHIRELILGFDIQPKRLGWAYLGPFARKSGCFTFSDFDYPFYWQQVDTAVLKVLEEVDRTRGEPVRFYIEQPFLLSVKIAYNYGLTMAYLRESLERYEPAVGIEWFQPAEWKKLSVGSGKASKEDIYATAVQYGFRPVNQDAADASMIAIAGSKVYDRASLGLSKDESKGPPRLQDIESWG